MLTHLSINNFTIVESLQIELSGGMTAITGETGAGKSIMLDALGLCLGDRAEPRSIRPGCARADITACFNTADVPAARAWLEAQELSASHECIMRRVISADRSRAWINGRPATVQQCAELGQHLVDIHSQHAHQSLLRKPVQRALLDAFAGASDLAATVAGLARAWNETQLQLVALRGASEETESRRQLLSYQVTELDELNPGVDELTTLEAEQKTLGSAEEILETAGRALELCDTLEDSAQQAAQYLTELHTGSRVDNARSMLQSAAIQSGEARSDLQAYLDSIDIHPQRLAEIEKRLDQIYTIARKHRVKPQQLPALQASLQSELEALSSSDASVTALEEQLAQRQSAWAEQARVLTRQRRQGAKRLKREATALFETLSMGQCVFEIALTSRPDSEPHPGGSEDVEFLISTNPGTAPQPLGRIASGGELSRISLAIQVATADGGSVPSMVFDEVDVGIGGAVAEVVGRLLRKLSSGAQVLCVTHLPQVAAQADHQLRVSKTGDRKSVTTALATLDTDGRVDELARMLGGLKVTAQTRAHAREMLDGA
ncbi:MAG: DNA repair protein RecN [Chromatocurvus sp.]